MSDMSNLQAGKKVFSEVNLQCCYHQIPVAANDTMKTAVITPFSLFKFCHTSIGLKGTA